LKKSSKKLSGVWVMGVEKCWVKDSQKFFAELFYKKATTCFAALAMMVGSVMAASAAPVTIQLSAANMLAQTHSHAVFVTITGTFQQLSGKLTYDQAAGTCAVDVTFVVASLKMPNALIQSQTMSAGFLDPAEYPTQHYVAICQGGMLAGQLTMRGQTHPFNMALTYEMAGGKLTGIHTEGVLNRHDWGINGMSLTVGKMIRVTNEIAVAP
jgi:polyisoprenoid-binding protein YceI